MQPLNVFANKFSAPVSKSLNNPLGIAARFVHPSNVPENIFWPPSVIPSNNVAGIAVKFVHPLNVFINRGNSPLPVPRCGNTDDNEPVMDAIFAWVPLLDRQNVIEESVPYAVAAPPNHNVCAPADPHVHLYDEAPVPVRLICVPVTPLPVNVPPSPQST